MNYPPKLKIIKTNAQDQSLNLKNDQDLKAGESDKLMFNSKMNFSICMQIP